MILNRMRFYVLFLSLSVSLYGMEPEDAKKPQEPTQPRTSSKQNFLSRLRDSRGDLSSSRSSSKDSLPSSSKNSSGESLPPSRKGSLLNLIKGSNDKLPAAVKASRDNLPTKTDSKDDLPAAKKNSTGRVPSLILPGKILARGKSEVIDDSRRARANRLKSPRPRRSSTTVVLCQTAVVNQTLQTWCEEDSLREVRRKSASDIQIELTDPEPTEMVNIDGALLSAREVETAKMLQFKKDKDKQVTPRNMAKLVAMTLRNKSTSPREKLEADLVNSDAIRRMPKSGPQALSKSGRGVPFNDGK